MVFHGRTKEKLRGANEFSNNATESLYCCLLDLERRSHILIDLSSDDKTSMFALPLSTNLSS